MTTSRAALLAATAAAIAAPGSASAPQADAPPIQGWQKGKGWGWIWGKDDEVGSLNAMTDASRAAALALATRGEVFDLGLTYSRRSFKWPGHSPGEIITFRSPDGIDRMKDPDAPPGRRTPTRSSGTRRRCSSATTSPPRSTASATSRPGADYHWYNGFKEADWGGDWGPRKCDATDHPADHRPGRPDRRRRLQEGRRPARPHRRSRPRTCKDTLAWEGVDAQARRRRPGPHRHRPLLGRGRRRPRQDRRARLGRPRPRRDEVARRGPGGDHGRLRHERLRGQPARRPRRARASRSIATCSSTRGSTSASSTTSKA